LFILLGGIQAKIAAAKALNVDHIILPYSNFGDV
jgi:ATP-dependent Lon protease